MHFLLYNGKILSPVLIVWMTVLACNTHNIALKMAIFATFAINDWWKHYMLHRGLEENICTISQFLFSCAFTRTLEFVFERNTSTFSYQNLEMSQICNNNLATAMDEKWIESSDFEGIWLGMSSIKGVFLLSS